MKCCLALARMPSLQTAGPPGAPPRPAPPTRHKMETLEQHLDI